MSQAVVKVDEV